MNDPPTSVRLVSNGTYENATAGTIVGVLQATDQDADQNHTFVVTGNGSGIDDLCNELLFYLIITIKLDFHKSQHFNIPLVFFSNLCFPSQKIMEVENRF